MDHIETDSVPKKENWFVLMTIFIILNIGLLLSASAALVRQATDVILGAKS